MDEPLIKLKVKRRDTTPSEEYFFVKNYDITENHLNLNFPYGKTKCLMRKGIIRVKEIRES